MGLFDSLFKSGKQTTTQSLPQYVEKPAGMASSFAEQYANQGPKFYEGDRVADLTPEQLGAYDMVSDRAGQGVDLSEALRRMLDGGGAPAQSVSTSTLLEPTNGANLDDYMNPYIKDVVAQTLQALDRDRQQQAVGIRALASQGGGFGGDRNAVLESENTRNFADIKGQQASRLYADAFNTAAGLKTADTNRLLDVDKTNAGLAETALQRLMSSATGAANISQAEIDQILKLAAAQETAGAAKQGQAQNEIDALMAKFTEGRDWNKDMSAFLAAIAGGLPAPVTTTTKTKSNPLASIAGLLGSAAKAAVGASTGNPAAAA